jgi:NAD-dependent SIR2 family protein deacetylase
MIGTVISNALSAAAALLQQNTLLHKTSGRHRYQRYKMNTVRATRTVKAHDIQTAATNTVKPMRSANAVKLVKAKSTKTPKSVAERAKGQKSQNKQPSKTTIKTPKPKTKQNKVIAKPKAVPKLEKKLNTKKLTLKLSSSTMTTTDEMRAQISKLATSDNDGLKYLTFQEFSECPTIHMPLLNLISKSRKMVILTGAGISCNAGIPDFRSETGLYNKTVGDSKKTIKGKEMFDISVYRSIDTVIAFNRFIHELYQQVLASRPTKTHEFIMKLQQRGKLIKCYTQNIDGLERECGLRTEFECTDGSTNKDDWNEIDVVQLHGDLHQLCCNSCKHSYKWDDIYDEEGRLKIASRNLGSEDTATSEDTDVQMVDDLGLLSDVDVEEAGEDNELMMLSQTTTGSVSSSESIFSTQEDSKSESSAGRGASADTDNDDDIIEVGSVLQQGGLIECPRCIDNYESRLKLGKRSLESSIGIIRPNIVLYGEEHPHSELFARNLMKDLNKKPNVLLIFGTSLKVTGVKNLVRRMAQKIHETDKGLVIMVNKDPVAQSYWKKYIDYQILSDCDAFSGFVEGKLPDVFT